MSAQKRHRVPLYKLIKKTQSRNFEIPKSLLFSLFLPGFKHPLSPWLMVFNDCNLNITSPTLSVESLAGH